MAKKFTYLINKKLNINGRQIRCKVTGEPGSANDGAPYVLAITGGPGFGHELTELYCRPLIESAEQENAKLPHFIFFDHLGCGESDKAIDKDKEYTIDHFTDLAADLVQAIKTKLGLKHMNLFVEGGSFGSLVAMDFPARKADWLDPESDIHLRQVISKVGPKGASGWEYTQHFLQENYSDHPNYENIIKAQTKLFAGDLKDQNDYVINFVLPMASLYAKNIDKSNFNKLIQALVIRYPNAVLQGLDLINRFFKNVGLEIDSLNFADITLGKCSLEVLNHFFKKDFDGFDIIETVKRNQNTYQKIPICLISSSEDHIVDYKIALTINELLPDTSAAIIFKESHMLSKGPNKNIYNKLNHDLFILGMIPEKDVNFPAITFNSVSNKFNECLADAHLAKHERNENNAKGFDTGMILSKIPKQDPSNPGVTTNESIYAKEIVNETINRNLSLQKESVQKEPSQSVHERESELENEMREPVLTPRMV